MDREQSSSELLGRLALEYFLSGRANEVNGTDETPMQHVPINVYETSEDVVLVAPMPGIEAENIDIQVTGSTVTLRSSLRGPGQHDRTYLVHEWTYGPYERTIELPMSVDVEHANASHGNGVLVLSLPKSVRSQTVRVPLRQLGSSGASHQGHSGHHSSREGLEPLTE